MISIEEMANIYLANLGITRSILEVDHLLKRITSYDGQIFWIEVKKVLTNTWETVQ